MRRDSDACIQSNSIVSVWTVHADYFFFLFAVVLYSILLNYIVLF